MFAANEQAGKSADGMRKNVQVLRGVYNQNYHKKNGVSRTKREVVSC